jgi:hypothetical protein
MKKEIKVFITNDVTMNGSNYTMDNFYSMNKDDASKLVSEGRAIEYGNDELNTYDKQIEQAVGAYRKQYDKLATSKDPRYKVELFFAEETGKLKKEMEAEVKRLQQEYSEIVKDVRNTAHQERANLTRNITPADETGAKQLMNELVSHSKLNGICKAIERIESDIQYFSEGRKAALANELHRLIDLVGEEDRPTKRRLRALSNKLREDTEGVELAARMASALPDDVGGAYTRLKATHASYKRR